MFKEIKKLILSSVTLLLMSCEANNKIFINEYSCFFFIRGIEMSKDEGYQYSENCFLYYSKYKFLAEENYKYENGELKKFVYCGPEGADLRDYDKENYSKDKLVYSKQKLYEGGKKIRFNDVIYNITYKKELKIPFDIRQHIYF